MPATHTGYVPPGPAVRTFYTPAGSGMPPRNTLKITIDMDRHGRILQVSSWSCEERRTGDSTAERLHAFYQQQQRYRAQREQAEFMQASIMAASILAGLFRR